MEGEGVSQQPVQQEAQQQQPAPEAQRGSATPEGPTPPSADVAAAQKQETELAQDLSEGADAGKSLQELAAEGFSDAEASELFGTAPGEAAPPGTGEAPADDQAGVAGQDKGWFRGKVDAAKSYFGRSSQSAEDNAAAPAAESGTGDAASGAEAQSPGDQADTETAAQDTGEAPTEKLTDQQLLDAESQLLKDYTEGKIDKDTYNTKMGEIAQQKALNEPQDTQSGPELSDPDAYDVGEDAPTSEDMHRELEETEGKAEDELTPEERATRQVEVNKQMLEIGAQLNAAGIDMNSEAGKQITEFLINNPDKAVVITTLMKEMGVSPTENTKALQGITDAAESLNQQIEDTDDPEKRRKLGVMKTILLLMAALLVSGAGGGLNAGAELIQNNLKR